MSSDRQLNYVNNLQNRDQNLYYIDDASELNSINLKENDKIYAINDNKLFQMEVVDQEEELSGSIVSFNGRNNTKIKSLVANIEPQQDLHGQANPYPAGGGKNILPVTVEAIKASNTAGTWNGNVYTYSGITFTVLTDDANNVTGIRINGTATATIEFLVSAFTDADRNTNLPNGSYILTGGIVLNKYINGAYSGTWSNNPNNVVIDDSTKAGKAYAYIGSGTVKDNAYVYPMIRLSTVSDDTFAPYSNICPISGWTGANVWDDPVYGGTIKWNQSVQNGNFADGTSKWSSWNGSISSSNNILTLTATASATSIYAYSDYVNIIRGHKYYAKADIKPSVNTSGTRISYSSNGTSIASAACTANIWTKLSNIFTASANSGVLISRLMIYLDNISAKAIGDTLQIRNVILCDLTQMFGAGNEPSTVAEFEALFPKEYYAYNAGEETCVSAVNGDPYWNIPIDWTDEAGTVYGGTLDVTTGVLTVEAVLEVFDTVDDLNNLVSSLDGLDYLGTSGSVSTIGDYTRVSFAVTQNTSVKNRYNLVSSSYDLKICNMLKHSFAYNEESAHWYRNTVLYAYFPTALVGSTTQSVLDYLASIKDTAPLSFWILLATPVTYQLDPVTVSTLLGENNIWADTGDITVKIAEKGITAFELKPYT